MKKISKKGEDTGPENENFTALIGEIVVGGMIIIGILLFLSAAINDTKEQVISKDLALTIGTLMSAPSDVKYKYAPNTEEFTITISDENKVIVSSASEKSSYNFLPLNKVVVQQKTLYKVLSVPINFEKGIISFEPQTATEKTDLCLRIPSYFSGNVTVSFKIIHSNSDSEKYFTALIEKIKALQSINANSHIEIVESYWPANLPIELDMEFLVPEDKVVFSYFETDIPNQQRASCFISTKINEVSNKHFTSIEEVPWKENKLKIDFGGLNEFEKALNKNPSLIDDYANAIYYGLEEATK